MCPTNALIERSPSKTSYGSINVNDKSWDDINDLIMTGIYFDSKIFKGLFLKGF